MVRSIRPEQRGVRLLMLISIMSIAGLLAACGGEEATTGTVAPAETTQATTEAMTTEASTMAADTAAFDAAAAQVVEATNALTALRAECFADENPIGCFTSREADFAAAEQTLASALTTAGAEGSAAGASSELCEASLEAIGSKLPTERTELLRRYGFVNGELTLAGSNFAGHATYYTTMLQQFASDPGFMVALGLGDCRLAVAPNAPNAQLLNATLAYVYGVILTRNAIGYGAWGLSFCLGDTPSEERASCLEGMGGPEDLTESLGKMSAGFTDMTAAPGYADLSSTCKSAFEQMNDSLSETGAQVQTLYGDAAALPASAETGDQAFEDAYMGVLGIAESTRPGEASPLDESTVVMCVEEVAAQG